MRPVTLRELIAMSNEGYGRRVQDMVRTIYDATLETAMKGEYRYKHTIETEMTRQMIQEIVSELTGLFPGVLVTTDYAKEIYISWR
jgi:hypothetical protein